MLKYCSLFFLILPILAFSQNEIVGIPFFDSVENEERPELTEMAIFPGCNKNDKKNFKKAQHCMQKALEKDLIKQLSNYVDRMDAKGQYKTTTTIEFVIDSTGNYLAVKPVEGQQDTEFSVATANAMKKILNKKSASIPGKVGERSVNMLIHLPVRYKNERPAEYPSPDIRVISTFTDQSQKLEVRYNRLQNVFQVYDISVRPNKFILKETDLNEVFKIEPFRSLLLNAGDKVLVTEGNTAKGFFRIYINFLNFAEYQVYKVKNGKEEFFTYASGFELETDKNFGPLLSRDKKK